MNPEFNKMDFLTTGDEPDDLLASPKMLGRNMASGDLTSLFTSGEGVLTGNQEDQSSDFKYRAPKKNSTLPQGGQNFNFYTNCKCYL